MARFPMVGSSFPGLGFEDFNDENLSVYGSEQINLRKNLKSIENKFSPSISLYGKLQNLRTMRFHRILDDLNL